MLKNIFKNKNNMKSALAVVTSASLVVLSFQACSGSLAGLGSSSTNSSASTGTSTTTTTTTTSANSVVAGQGPTVSGTGALTCPTANGIVTKLQNVLGVSVTTGNFAKAYTSLIANLPQTSDCTKANGFDNAQMLIYAGCSDLTTGTTNSMATKKYGITLTGSVASNQANLIKAGITMLDAYTGGLASGSSATTSVTTAITNLLTSTTPPSTSTIAFMDVCIAASSAGSILLGN
jgi:hypothetical protein